MIDILLATYNGEKYIEAQIYSLLAQTHKNWKLIIHDDGSTDKTIEIIKKFEAIDNRIYLVEDGIICDGAAKNFLHLLKFCTAEYVMFCDQDDIWFESKIECLLKEVIGKTIPFAAYSNGYTYNGEIITSQNFITFHRSTLKNSLFLNGGIHGCCILFNRQLLDLIKNNMPSFIYMHDHFITILAVTFGEMRYVNKQLMLYRQHTNNVTGNIKLTFSERLKSFLCKSNPVIEKRHYNANKAFYEHFKNKLSKDQIVIFKAYLRYPKVSLLNRLIIVQKYGFISQNKIQLLIKTLTRKAI